MLVRLSIALLVPYLLLLANPVGAQPGGLFFRHPSPPWRYVTTVMYQGQPLRLERTPSSKRPRPGRQAIGALEAQLAVLYRALLASDTACFIRPAQSDSLFAALTLVRSQYPHWNTELYTQEARFYEGARWQRQAQRLGRRFTQGQQQLDSLRTPAQAWAATASFSQVAQAGRAAEQTKQWASAEVYLARCLALRPTDDAIRARHALVSEYCLWQYFTRWVRASQRVRQHWPVYALRPLRLEPVYSAAEPLVASYLEGISADYTALALDGQPTYLYQAVEVYALTRELLPRLFSVSHTQRAEELLQAYSQCYGFDSHWRYNKQQLREAQQVRSASYD